MDQKVQALEDSIEGIKTSIAEISNKINKIVVDSSETQNQIPSALQDGDQYLEASASAEDRQGRPVQKQDPNAQHLAIKAQVQGIKIPIELTLQTPTGLKKTETQSLTRTARAVETVFKILANAENHADPFGDIFTTMLALMNYLQDEQASLVVKNTFDPTVAKFFRNLRRGSGFSAEALEDLRSAAAIASAYRPGSHQQNGRGRGGDSRGGFRGRDYFSRHAGRGFPSHRGGRGNSHSHSTEASEDV